MAWIEAIAPAGRTAVYVRLIVDAELTWFARTGVFVTFGTTSPTHLAQVFVRTSATC
jgi:hypothetical protein